MALQKLWTSDRGTIRTFTASGEKPQRKPHNQKIASKRGGHYVGLGNGPWSHSFDRVFAKVDDIHVGLFREFVHYLVNLDSHSGEWLNYFSDDKLDAMCRVSLSVIVRSPAFQRKKSFVKFGAEKWFDPEVGKMNILSHWRSIERVDQFSNFNPSCAILFSQGSSEFVIGDGFFEDSVEAIHRGVSIENGILKSRARGFFLFPVCPTISIFVMFNGRGNMLRQELNNQEVNEVNEVTKISSIFEIYSRSINFQGPYPICNDKVRSVRVWNSPFIVRVVSRLSY